MPKSSYPAHSDVLTYLQNIGVELPSGFSATGYAAQAWQQWERRSGFIPFLGDTVDKVRIFDPPGPNTFSTYYWRLGGGGLILYPDCGFWSITSLYVGVANQEVGTEYTQGLDYFVDPPNNPVMGEPYDCIRFVVRQFGPQESVQITGRWGWGAQIPDDAWEAIRRLGGSLALSDIAEGLRTGALTWKDGDTSESIPPGQLDKLGSSARGYAEDILMGYTRARL